MNGRAYYNECDPAAAAILRELVARNVIARGDVDDRSIKDVRPSDLAGYTQCHFFAGGGLWSVAARLAGWPDERPLWTGSCPCQPFSAAGKGLGADDPRHLWPDFHRLIRACRPVVVMGEQVAGAAGYGWFDGVRADLEVEDYASRCVDIPACAVDALHQRNRLYWIAMDDRRRARRPIRSISEIERRNIRYEGAPAAALDVGADGGGSLLQSDSDRCGRSGRPKIAQRTPLERTAPEWPADELLADTAGERRLPAAQDGIHLGEEGGGAWHGQPQRPHAAPLRNGSWWADGEWVVSPLDGKARRAKPGIPFLVDGITGRVDLWRVGGNAIVPILAAEVIAAFLETESIGVVP